MKIWAWRISYTTLTAFFLLGLTSTSVQAKSAEDMELRIGVVQRFGNEKKDQLWLEPVEGDNLRLNFKSNGKEQTIVTANPIKLEVNMMTLSETMIDERVVLGTFRTFETAEDSAIKWREQGIEVEIAQPERWQVWAKREVYNTPLLRRLLLDNVKKSGQKTAYVKSKVTNSIPRVSWVKDNIRYNRIHIKISSGKNLIRVKKSQNSRRGRVYPGDLQIQPNAYGSYTLVNEVPLEQYLRGVVPYEIGSKSPAAALETQAIIARTYALNNLRRFAVDNYQLCADTHCQVYFGITGATPTTDKAIAATRGMVLTYENELVDTLYSSTTGGVTASFTDVWNGKDRPYLKPIIDAPSQIWNLSGQNLSDEDNFQRFISLEKGFNESEQKWFRWRRETKIEDITKGLQKFLKVKNSPFAKFKVVKDIQVVERSTGGRILKLAVATDIGTFHLYKDEVRSAFAAPISTLFYLQRLNKGKPGTWGYAFIGGGFGHGVGLSQVGAQNLARSGWNNAKILEFYYPETKLQKLTPQLRASIAGES
ncbi:MAG: SpoIID/LytB domain-containing protein [Cyanobacteria bacterium P01_A01_bin.45]